MLVLDDIVQDVSNWLMSVRFIFLLLHHCDFGGLAPGGTIPAFWHDHDVWRLRKAMTPARTAINIIAIVLFLYVFSVAASAQSGPVSQSITPDAVYSTEKLPSTFGRWGSE